MHAHVAVLALSRRFRYQRRLRLGCEDIAGIDTSDDGGTLQARGQEFECGLRLSRRGDRGRAGCGLLLLRDGDVGSYVPRDGGDRGNHDDGSDDDGDCIVVGAASDTATSYGAPDPASNAAPGYDHHDESHGGHPMAIAPIPCQRRSPPSQPPR